jgi:hypothetical protein
MTKDIAKVTDNATGNKDKYTINRRYMSAVGLASEILGVGLIATSIIQEPLFFAPGIIAYGFGRGALEAVRDQVEENRFQTLEKQLRDLYKQ